MTIHGSAPDRSLSKGARLVLSAFLIGVVLLLYFVFIPRSVPGQALVDIQSIETLSEQFNLDVGKTRLILIASPT